MTQDDTYVHPREETGSQAPIPNRFEWLEIPNEPRKQTSRGEGVREATPGKRCPACGWLQEETATVCFRCGHLFNQNDKFASRFAELGIALPPRLIEAPQSLEAFFRTHGRIRPSVSLPLFDLRMRAEMLRLSRGFDQLICLDELDVEHYQHQIDAALRALRDMRGRALLADEVGLGKTIEAGIIMKELLARGLVKTVLVLTPASLTEQWREELADKFHEEFTPLEDIEEVRAIVDVETGRWIVSLDRAKLKVYSETILGREYDLLIVDEAHKLKNRSTLAWQFVNRIRKRYVLMLTATPIQNDLMELYSLITILSPGQLGTVRAFRKHFLSSADARQPRNSPTLRRLLNDVMIRNRRSKVEITFPRRRAAIVHLQLSDAEFQLYADVTDYIRRRFRQQESNKALRLTLVTLQRELSSSPQAVAATLRKMCSDREHSDAVRAELDRFRTLAESIPAGRKLHAVREILEKYPGKFLIFTEYRATMEVIVQTLSEWGVRAVAFHGGLSIKEKEEAVAAFRGDAPEPIVSDRRSKGRRRSKSEDAQVSRASDANPKDGDAPAGEVRVMVSTESGGEGRNLQFCHQLINYDLPWNPMRVEQRIGRLHRLGQQHEVIIFNLSCNETIEAHVIDLLARKIRMFELVIGELDLILGSVEGDRSFEDLLRTAWASATSEGDLIERLNALGDVLVRARRSYDEVQHNNRALDIALDGEEA